MTLFTNAKVSPAGSVNQADVERVLHNALVFLSAPILIYLLQVYGLVSQNGHVFSLKDFAPSAVTIGAIVSWFLSTIIDFFKKLNDSSK